MALHKLTIMVIDGGKSDNGGLFGSGNNKPKNAELEKWKSSKTYKLINFNQTVRENAAQEIKSPTTRFALQSSINLATQTARQFINYYVSDIGRSSGDSNYQAMINRRIEQVTDPLSIASSALSGAATGSAFGPIGALVGATAGAISSSVSVGFKYAERERAYAHEMFKENNSQAYNVARANYSVWTGRVR